ncbi:MAG: exodeoxyribonuclease VII large subunit [Bacteroidales bacterium]|nr:exodeoxyribonuclease VII large subunit [Bacteroidales bacterium]
MSEIPSKYYTLSKVAASLQSVIRREYSQYYWIKAEISRLNFYPKSGHCYPDLVEKDHAKVLAQMRAIIWSRDYFRINADFVKKTGRALDDGMEILFKAKLEYSPTHGFSLMIVDVSAEFVLGKMALDKKLTLERLKTEGLYYRNKEVKFPVLPQRIAIISVDTSKGFHDFINIIDNNTRGYKFFWMLFPALLQGDGAVQSIIQQLQQIKSVQHHFDMVAIIRGGGGDVGLSCYDHYDLSSEVANFPIPVISGIGHSTNETLVEMVAHYNPITPTDLAYFLQQKFDNLAVGIEEIQQAILAYSKDSLLEKNNQLSDFSRIINSETLSIMEYQANRLSRFGHIVQHSSLLLLEKQRSKLDLFIYNMRANSSRLILEGPQKVVSLENRLKQSVVSLVHKNEKDIKHFEEKIQLMKPENLLKKGYSLTLFAGKPISSTNSLKEGDILQTQLFEGKIESKITKIRKK